MRGRNAATAYAAGITCIHALSTHMHTFFITDKPGACEDELGLVQQHVPVLLRVVLQVLAHDDGRADPVLVGGIGVVHVNVGRSGGVELSPTFHTQQPSSPSYLFHSFVHDEDGHALQQHGSTERTYLGDGGGVLARLGRDVPAQGVVPDDVHLHIYTFIQVCGDRKVGASR